MTSTTPETGAKGNFAPFLFLIGLAAINLIAPFVPISNIATAVLLSALLTIGYVGLVIGFGLSIAKQRLPLAVATGLTAVSAVVWFGIENGVWPIVRQGLRAAREAHAVPSTGQQLQFFACTTIQDLAMVAGACLVGTMLAKLIKHANMLGPIGAAIALIDIWGVLFGGIVSQMLTNKATQPLAERAMAAGPKVGVVGAARPEFSIEVPSIGVGDFLFIVLLLSVLVNLSMNWKSAARWMWVFVAGALLSINFLPFFPHLPGLLFIAGAVILPNLKYFTFTREERFALLYAGIFVVLITGGLYVGFKSMLPPDQNPQRNPRPRTPAAVRPAPTAPRTN